MWRGRRFFPFHPLRISNGITLMASIVEFLTAAPSSYLTALLDHYKPLCHVIPQYPYYAWANDKVIGVHKRDRNYMNRYTPLLM